MEPEPIRFLINIFSRRESLRMDRLGSDSDELVDPSSPTYVCFAAISAFIAELLRPRRISSGSSVSSRSSKSP